MEKLTPKQRYEKFQSKLDSGVIVKIIKCHHCLTEDCVGKLATVDKEIVKNSVYRIRIDGEYYLFGRRDLQFISAYEMLDWNVGVFTNDWVL